MRLLRKAALGGIGFDDPGPLANLGRVRVTALNSYQRRPWSTTASELSTVAATIGELLLAWGSGAGDPG